MVVNDFSGWIPMRIYWQDSRPMVDWGHLGTRRFTEPFFGQTINDCVRHPADLLFRHQTPLDSLDDIAATQASVRPTGFIFHMSRCGSTLLSQMLAATPENIVISEPSPVDAILRAHFHALGVTEERRVQWLQWLVSVLGWRRHPAETNLFIKFDCWHALFLPLIQRAFPGVPWVFVYREPLEVMASHLRQRGAQMIPGALEPGLFGWDPETVALMALNEYGARTLAKICTATLEAVREGKGKLVNYHQLPDAIWPALMEYWNLKCSADGAARMIKAKLWNAKNPVLPFEADSQAKRDTAPAEIRGIVHQWLDGIYQQLESQRSTSGFR